VSAPFAVRIAGVGVWSRELPGWDAARAWLEQSDAPLPPAGAARPAPSLLPPTERRRAPDSVLLAIEAAQQACAHASCDPATLPHVFASAYGDLAINDYLCATLVDSPNEVSPTKFHNSVHNAPAGYWAIATGCGRSSTALSAGADTFGAGLLEAALTAAAERTPTLLVAYDVAATGLLAQIIPCDAPFAVAFVLTPDVDAGDVGARAAVSDADVTPTPGRVAPRLTLAAAALAPGTNVLHASYARNPAARSLPLLAALARRRDSHLHLAAGPALALSLEISF